MLLCIIIGVLSLSYVILYRILNEEYSLSWHILITLSYAISALFAIAIAFVGQSIAAVILFAFCSIYWLLQSFFLRLDFDFLLAEIEKQTSEEENDNKSSE